ncbi:MuF-C-terminal domain-containing protein [Selenomonas montiformis]|uniref:MuF-C-terminal domain-containing protein n=1 Tax=Selenomonas montiformis TaxID=2652285 RepID=UPI003F8924B1
MSIISDYMLRNNDNDRASAQYASSQPYSQIYSGAGSSGDSQHGLLDRIFNGLGSAYDWLVDNGVFVRPEDNPMYNGGYDNPYSPSSMYSSYGGKFGDAFLDPNQDFHGYDTNTYSGSMLNAAANGAASTIGNIADLFHFDPLGDRLNQIAKQTDDPDKVDAGFSLDYITNPHGLARSFGNMLGSMAVLAPAAAVVPESAVGVGANAIRKLGGDALASKLAQYGLERTAAGVAPAIQNGVRWAATSVPEALAEGGGVRRQAMELGLDDADALAWKTAALNLPLLVGSNFLEGALLGNGILNVKAPAKWGMAGRMATAPVRALPTAAAESLQNGTEEAYQQAIQNGNTNQEYGILPWKWTDDQKEAFLEGAFGSLPLGLVGGTFHGMRNQNAAMDPVLDAQLQGKNNDVPTVDGIDVTEIEPGDYMNWLSQQMDDNGIRLGNPDADVSSDATDGAKDGAGTNVMDAAQDFMGERMENGENGCVEAVTKIGARFNPFLADELNKGVVNVDTLVSDAGDAVVPFDPANVQAGDVIVYGDNDHVVIADGNGGYVGNSSSQQKVVHGDDYNNMGDLKPTKIIKTGSGAVSSADSGQGSADLSGLVGGGIASAIAQRTGLPANLIWAQLAHESDNFSSQLAREDHNYGGITNSDGSYRHFDSDEDFVDFMANYYPKYKENGLYDANNADEWASALKDGGYFTADLGEYEGGMKRRLADAGLSDGAGDISAAPVQTAAKNMTLTQFGDLLTSKLIDFAGTNDDTVRTVFNDISTSKDTTIANLFALYMQNGVFQNTADARAVLAKNDAFRKALSMFIHAHIGDYAPTVKDGKVTISDAREALRLRPAGKVQAPHIDVKNLSSADKKAIMAAAKVAMQTPQGLSMDEEVRFMTKLSKAIDYKDYTAIANLIPQQAAQAVMAAREADTAADKSAPVMQDTARANGSVNETATQAPISRQAQNQIPASEAVNGPVPVNHAQETMQNVSVQASANHVSDGVRAAAPTRDVARVKEIGAMPVDTRKVMGERYLSTLRANNVPFSEKRLAKPLAQGKPEAIEFAERKYGDVLNTVTPAEAAAMQVAARGPVAPMEAGNNARTNVEEAIANENTQSEYAADKNAENQNQHAKPEPRKAAESQPEAKAGAVSAPQSVPMESDPSYLRQLEKEKANRERAKRILANSVWAGIEKELTPEGLKKLRDAAETSAVRGEDHLMADLADILPSDFKNPPKNFREAIRRGNAVTDKVNRLLASDNKKAADEGGRMVQELAPGYKTESGKPLSEADDREFILKPDGSKDFGEITDAISKAAKEQSGADLAPGKIRLRVGNDKEGLLHAKKHEEQAKADGYASIEDMIADVADNFDSIYAHGLTGNGHTTYSLVKHGNKATGKMNGVAPVYLNLEDDGHGNYYVIVTAIPKGDANLARQTKKDRLIYSSPGLGATTESNAGAVSTSAKNVGAETRGGTPTSDKSSGLSTSSVAQTQDGGKKKASYTDGSFSDKTKEDNAMRGTVKNGVMTIWRKGSKKKDTPIITVSVDEVDKALKKGGANSEYTLAQLARQKDYAAVEAWIERTKKPELRQRRRDEWEEDKLYPLEDRDIDSAVRVIKKLYETATGEPPRSPWEKNQEVKSATTEVRTQETTVKGTVDKAAMKPGSADWIAAHPFRYDKAKSVEENSAEATRIAQAYRKKFGETCEINTPERIALRRRIIEELYGNGAEKKEHKAFIVIGLPSSGKSSAVAEPLAKKYGALLIDSDEAKERLPEFTDGLLADAVHEESSDIADRVRTNAIGNGDNIVLPLVGKTESKLRNLVSLLKNNGYKVNLHYVDLPVDKAVERGKTRFAETGRNVPLAYIRSVGLKPKHNFDKLKIAKEVDSYGEWSNDVDRGQRPRLLEERPAGLYSQGELAGRGQRVLHEDGGIKEDSEQNQKAQGRGKDSADKVTNQENRSDHQDGFSMRENQASLMGKAVGGPAGKETTVMTDSGKEIRVRYRLVPTNKVITSHDAETMTPNKAYPQELQPRDRQRVSMQAQVTTMANELRPADLGAGRNLNQGAPVIRKDGVVLNGNGRAMAIQKARATRNNSASEYKKYLVQHAGEFGFTPETVMKLDKPMLVREVMGDINADTLRDIVGSTTGGSRMGAGEQAKIDAQKIKISDLECYVENDNGDITTAANRDFVAGILYRIAGKNEQNAYTDKVGNVNADGIQRVKRALFSLAYEDDDLISKMAESTDDNARNVSNALMNAAPAIAKVNLEMGEGKIYQYDVAETISEAVKRFSALRDEGKPVSTYLDEQSLFNSYEDTDEMRDVLRFFDENKRSAKRIGAFLNEIAEEIEKQGDARQTSLIATAPQSLKQVIKYAADTATGKEESLFANSESAAQEEGSKKNVAKDDSIFGSVEDADKEMLDALGLSDEDLKEEVLEAPEGISNTAEEREKLEKELAAVLRMPSAMPMFNPKIYTLGLKLAMTYVKDGYNTFKKLVTKLHATFGDKIGPWAPALAETVRTWPKGVPFDEKKVMVISKAVGARYENGITSLDDMQADMKKLLKGQHKSFAPMIEASYNGIRKFFEEQEGEKKHADDSTSGLAERAGRGPDSDGVGTDDAGGVSGRGSEPTGVPAAGAEDGAPRGVRVRDGGAAAGGATGHRGVQADESGDRAGSAGGAGLSRSTRDSYDGSTGPDAERATAADHPAEKGQDHAGHSRTGADGVKPNDSHKPGDLGSIRHDLPMLTPEQQEDVVFIEKRLSVNDKPGVMLTNGTGTGKTYSGLGFVKRMWDAGKKNILIVSPAEDINNQWIDAAKDHFDLDIHKLADTTDCGTDGQICITTYANMQANKELVQRHWDAVIADESHNLMNNKDGGKTGAVSMLRAITMNPHAAYDRFRLLHRTKEIRFLEDKIKGLQRQLTALDKSKKDQNKALELQKKIESCKRSMDEIYRKISPNRDKLEDELKKAYPDEKRPKVLFLSATPFAYDKDVDYAEGYLFHYDDKQPAGGYNEGSPFDRFMMKHFGYRMRYNKLTRPDADVDSRAMEVQFHDTLVNSGAMYGRQIAVDKDYDRGFILVDGGIGHKIDEGFQYLSDHREQYNELYDALYKQFSKRQKKYLLESIKAKEVIPLIKAYVKQGKKVVLFHQAMVEKNNVHPFVLKFSAGVEDTETLLRKYRKFKEERPDLVGLSLSDIPSPMQTIRDSLGSHAMYVDGRTSKKDKAAAIKRFNDDDSGLNVIVCQQDAANAGISLHDTTGKHPRVLINIAMPERPSYAMQIEGRIYRVGNASNAVFRYLSTGTDIEKDMFASTIGGRAASVENLAMGDAARGLRESFRDLYQETMDGSWRRRLPGAEGEGTGGKELDQAAMVGMSDYERAKSFYYAHQKRTTAMKAREGNDYFATPEPIGLKMVEWLGLKLKDKVLEPSAGHGAISRWFPGNTERTIVEPSSELMPLAMMNTPDAKAVHGRFENFNIVNKFDGIAMNPPFGTGGKTAVEHLQKAFHHLRDGGRVMAILPEGPAADKRLDKLLEEISDEAVRVADIHLPAVTFSRAGTKVMTHIVVLDRYTNKAEREAAQNALGTYEDIDLRHIEGTKELFDRLEGLTLPDRADVKKQAERAKDAESKFTTGTYEHTKTHETMFKARPKMYLGDSYREVSKLAKEHDGYYSRYADNSFLFQNEEDRDAFVKQADELLGEKEERYSAEEQLTADSRAWKETLREAWKGNMPDSTMLPVMQTPVALKLVGVPDYPMVMRQSKLMKIKKDHPEMTKAILNQLPSYLADPMIIFKSSTVPGRLVVGLELKDEAGIHVVVPVELNAKAGRVDVNVITSAYGKGVQQTGTNVTWFVDNILEGNTVYINKKQAADFYQSAGLQLPMEGRRFNDLFGSSIKTDADLVKAKLENPERYFAEEQQEEQTRALDDLKQEVRDALPGARDIRDDGNRLSFTMPNGAKVEVQLSPSIDVSETAASRARAAHGIKPSVRVKINGRERTIGTTALVELSQLGRKGSAYHEVLHAVYDLCLTEKEKAALHRAFDKEAKAQGRDVYEAMADQYRDWMLARQQGRGTRFGKLWQKVKDMAAALLRVLRGADHASDVFRKVESGEVWKRATDAGKTQKKYSAEGVENPGEADYNEDKVSKSVFDKYLNDGIMQMVRETVAKEIGEHVDLAEMSDPVKRDAARDRLPYIRDMLVKYHQLVGMKMKPAYIDRMAAKIEYARRCFDHDERVEHGALRQVVGMQKPSGVYLADDAALRSGQKESRVNGGRVRVQRGISRSISGEKSDARAHFLKLYNDMAKSRSDNQGGFSSVQNPTRYSAEAEEAPRNFADKVFLKLTGRSHINGDKIIVEERKSAKGIDDVLGVYLRSPSRIASKVARFRLFWRMADRAMNMLTKKRSYYMRKMAEAMKLVKNKDDRQMLYEVMLQGDAEGKEYTRQELADMGAGDNVIEAYVRLRRLMTKAYHMVDDTRRRPVIHSKHLADSEIADLRDNPFVEVMAVGDADDTGRKLVTYKEYANYQKEYQGIDAETLQRFREDDSMQVLDERRNVDGTYDVKVREGVPHLNRLKGYIPHLFHEYMVRIQDKDGNYVATLGSGRTEAEAVRLADEYLKNNELEAGQEIHVSPKVFSFNKLGMDEGQYGAVMGDSDYDKMIGKLAKDNDMTLAEARELVGDSVRRKSRHRFFGNTMHRTGVGGYEKNLDWVLRHYFSSASRYAAMETEFKPHAISLYERLYGDFYRDAPSAEANYVKQYINDLNGNPSWLEKAITNLLNHSRIWRNFFVPHYGERAALTLANDVTHVTSSLCLGFLNTSSAILNFTQAMNAAAYIGDVSALVKCIAKGAHRKYSMHDLKILNETNVLNDIGLDSGSGYDMNRGSAKRIWGKIDRGGMWMFKTSEGIVRRGTVLAAYETGRKRGMSHAEAIEFAKDINRKSNFDYGVADAPNIFRRGSVASQFALQFKKYGIKELEVVADMFPGNSKTSMKQKAIFWGTFFFLSGLMGFPGLDLPDGWLDGKLKLSIEEHMMEMAGNDPVLRGLVKTFLFGGLSATLNVDLSNRAGLSDVIPTKLEDFLGPAVSKTLSFIRDAIQGNGMNAIRDMSPGIYNILAAGIGYSEGKRGRVNDRYNTFYDRLLRAIGFKSTDERVNSDIDRIVRMRKSAQTSREQEAIDDYIDEPTSANRQRLKDMGISDKRVETERKKKQQDRRVRTQTGMSKKAKMQNERLMQFGE